jgi:hypothetical protein
MRSCATGAFKRECLCLLARAFLLTQITALLIELDLWPASPVRSHQNEPRRLAARAVRARSGEHHSSTGVYRRLRAHLRKAAMIYFTALITLLLFVYLGTALVRPEWF